MGVDAYCTFFEEDEFQHKSLRAYQIMDHAFSIIDDSDLLFVIQTSESKSEGMLMEVGYCRAKNIPIIVATQQQVGATYVPDMGTVAFRWDDLNDLRTKIQALDFAKRA